MELNALVTALEEKYPIILELYGNKDGLTLSRIQVDKEHQGEGIGTKVMSEIVNFADANGLVIVLTPEKIGNTSKPKLIKFYNGFGFVPNKGKNKNWAFREAMIRYPENSNIMKEEKIKGGKADNKTVEDLAKKHNVSVEDINKEIETGVEIEIEHTKDKDLAKEISMDHIDEFPKYYTHPKYGLMASEKKMKKELEESTIKTMLREALDLNVNDETPETVTYLLKANDRPAGRVEIAPNTPEMDKYTIELVDLDVFEDYDDIKTGTETMTAIWKAFPDAMTIVLTPEEGTLQFWEKLGAKPLNDSYWFIKRGH